MKARVKATGEDVEVEFVERKTHTGEQVYMTHEGCLIEESRLDFNVESIDYWTKLEHQYAGMFLQALISYGEQEDLNAEEMVEDAMIYAHALVEKMKEAK